MVPATMSSDNIITVDTLNPGDGGTVTATPPKRTFKAPPPLNTFLDEQAAPVRIMVTLPKDKMKAEMDAKFYDFVEHLTDNQRAALTKGGYRKISRERVYRKFGGMVNFYGDMFHNVIRDEAKSKGREILSVYNIEVEEMAQGIGVQAIVYLEPTVAWQSPPPATFKVHIAELSDDAVQKRTQDRVARIVEEQAVYLPVERTKLEAGDFVYVTLQDVTLDGDKFAPFNWANQNVQFKGSGGQVKPFFLDDYLERAELVDGAARLDIDTTQPTAEGDHNIPFAGMTIRGQLLLSKPTIKQAAAVDDELAVSAGYENLAQMLATFTKDSEDTLTREREDQITGAVVRSLVEKATVSPVPELWMRNKAQELIEQQLREAGSERRLLNKIGMDSIDRLFAVHMRQLGQQLRVQLVLRSFGLTHSVAGDHSLDTTPQYTQAVVRHVLNTVELIDADNATATIEPWWPVDALASDDNANDGTNTNPEE